MPASHPTFDRGHCMMVEPLSKPEVMTVAALMMERLRFMRTYSRYSEESRVEYADTVRSYNAIFRKMDYPEFKE